MAIDKNKDSEARDYYYLKCLNCGAKHHADRLYCECGQKLTDIEKVVVGKTKEKPILRPMLNIDDISIKPNCFECGIKDCKYCPGFGSSRAKYFEGMWIGGSDCKYESECHMCMCCRLYTGGNYPTNIDVKTLVFVRYGNNKTTQATRPEDLYFGQGVRNDWRAE